MSSKDVGIRIRVEKELREAFREACASENMLASDVLREFMRHFSFQHDSGKQASLFETSHSIKADTNATLSLRVVKHDR
jgi:hypothetical protein